MQSLFGQQQAEFLQDLLRYCVRHGANELCRTGSPIQTLDLIRQNDAADGQTGRQVDFEGVPFDDAGNGT